ncbi:MAG TPA: tetratricopeptide repeat protein [Oculatellaceae cyanobacterium]
MKQYLAPATVSILCLALLSGCSESSKTTTTSTTTGAGTTSATTATTTSATTTDQNVAAGGNASQPTNADPNNVSNLKPYEPPKMAPGFPGKGDSKDWTKATKFYNDGIDRASAKDYKEAIKLYNQAIEVYPYDPMFYANLGFALERNSQPKEGVDACKKAISLQKDFGGAWENLGNCQYDLGDLKGSLDSFNQALKCDLPMPKRTELLKVVDVLTKKIAETGGK